MEKQREKEEMGKNENVTVLCLQKVVMSFTKCLCKWFWFSWWWERKCKCCADIWKFVFQFLKDVL